MEQKSRVKDEHTTKSKTSIGKLLLWALAVLFLGGIGWQAWKLHLYNTAVRQAEEAGFKWEREDAFSLIKQDWRNALNKVTWGPHPRVLEMGDVPDLGHYRDMLYRLRPTVLRASGCNDENVDALMGLTSLHWLFLINCTALQNVDALTALTGLHWLELTNCPALQNVDALTALTGLHWLELTNCPALQNVDALKGLTALHWLGLANCPALQNVDALKGLTALQRLEISDCTALQNVDALKKLTALKTLHLRDCPSLQNVDALKGLTTLQSLALVGCTTLQNVDALKGLTSLQKLALQGSDKIPAAALRELRAALPKTDITFPDATGNPPQ